MLALLVHWSTLVKPLFTHPLCSVLMCLLKEVVTCISLAPWDDEGTLFAFNVHIALYQQILKQ
jgi:hypothetical protein